MTWVYIKSESNLWMVGFYDPQGKWHSESDHATSETAAARVHWLNGGNESEAINSFILSVKELGRAIGARR